MPTPFAAIEARINAAVTSHLANATADFGGGVVVEGMLDAAYTDAMGMAGTRPRLRIIASTVPADAEGAAITIGGNGYTVETVRPDGYGMLELYLNEAA
jgi:hypothetical protein